MRQKLMFSDRICVRISNFKEKEILNLLYKLIFYIILQLHTAENNTTLRHRNRNRKLTYKLTEILLYGNKNLTHLKLI